MNVPQYRHQVQFPPKMAICCLPFHGLADSLDKGFREAGHSTGDTSDFIKWYWWWGDWGSAAAATDHWYDADLVMMWRTRPVSYSYHQSKHFNNSEFKYWNLLPKKWSGVNPDTRGLMTPAAGWRSTGIKNVCVACLISINQGCDRAKQSAALRVEHTMEIITAQSHAMVRQISLITCNLITPHCHPGTLHDFSPLLGVQSAGYVFGENRRRHNNCREVHDLKYTAFNFLSSHVWFYV